MANNGIFFVYLYTIKIKIMKKLFLIPAALLFSFCSSKKDIVKNSEENKPVSKIESHCPSDGKCTIETFRGKSLIVKQDEFGSTYTQLEDNPETTVIQYQYNKNVKGDLQDANYREEVLFEIKNSTTQLNLSGNNLQQTKMLFGRFCFCRGQTGYYKIEQGNLKLNQNENNLNFTLDFTITKVPQIIKYIETSIN